MPPIIPPIKLFIMPKTPGNGPIVDKAMLGRAAGGGWGAYCGAACRGRCAAGSSVSVAMPQVGQQALDPRGYRANNCFDTSPSGSSTIGSLFLGGSVASRPEVG